MLFNRGNTMRGLSMGQLGQTYDDPYYIDDGFSSSQWDWSLLPDIITAATPLISQLIASGMSPEQAQAQAYAQIAAAQAAAQSQAYKTQSDTTPWLIGGALALLYLGSQKKQAS